MLNKKSNIISPNKLKQLLPLTKENKQFKNNSDKAIKNILAGIDNRFLVIAGPCSVDDFDSAILYLNKLKKLAEAVKDKIYIIPRLFVSKPRTKGEGFLGMLFQPEDENIEIEKGIIKCRKLFLECLNLSLPIADELLYSDFYFYFDDLINYYVIGARSCESQMLRCIASGSEAAVGIKNSMNGNLNSLASSLYTVSQPKEFLFNNKIYHTDGNKYLAAILRGYVDNKNISHSNFDNNTLTEFAKVAKENNLEKPFVIIDVSHSNSDKDCKKQLQNITEIMTNKNSIIKGLMMESYLFEGKGDGKGYSKTDECISFAQTEEVVKYIYQTI